MAIWGWSKTASSNATADSNINWQEGQNPSTVNDSSRAMMAAIKAGVSLPCSSMSLTTASLRSRNSRKYASRVSNSRNWMSSRPPVTSLR